MRGSVVMAGSADPTPAPETAADADGPIGWTDPNPAPAPAPTSTPLWRRIPIGWVVVVLVIVAGGIGGAIFNAARDSSGGIVKQGDLTVADLRVGDCYDLKDAEADVVEQVTAIPCTSEHKYEMFFVGSMSSGEYPTDEAFETFLFDNCASTFETFVGTAYADSILELSWFTPTQAGWNSGDRAVQCAVYHPTIERIAKSLKGSKQ